MSSTTLLATDQQRSVLNTLKANQPPQAITYSCYGHRTTASGFLSVLGFNGEMADPMTGHYLLGNGYRAFNPVLMRFNRPDILSPFGKGGLNSYAYCLGDPINSHDPNGRFALPTFLSRIFETSLRRLGITGQTYMSGPEKIFKTPTAKRKPKFSYNSITNLSDRRHSSAPKNALKSSTEELTKWDLIGYHGSTQANAESLMTGLNPRYSGSTNGVTLGNGFYITPDYNLAAGYASLAARSQNSTPKIYSVYTNKLTKLKPGRDYSPGASPIHKPLMTNEEFVIREPAYSSMLIREANKTDRVAKFSSHHEAPF